MSDGGIEVHSDMQGDPAPHLLWDYGTAYDLFLSLQVLHFPEKFGLRASWAAGVRSRLSSEDRKTLEQAVELIYVPLNWLYTLPDPKDATSALWALKQLPAEERLPALTLGPEPCDPWCQTLKDIAGRGIWNEADLETIKEHYRQHKHEAPREKVLVRNLETWANSAEFGVRYLDALQSYYQVFFAEEEHRIASILKVKLKEAKSWADELPLPELIEQLSLGVQVQRLWSETELVFVPSYWITPLIIFDKIGPQRSMMIFGARPEDVSLVPGEVIPEVLLRTLKTLADPTRLRILRFLTHEPLTPAEISRRLRLRAPTVTHHLRALRLAGLVHMMLVEHKEGHYTARLEAIDNLGLQLKAFLESDQEDEVDSEE